MHTIKPLDVQAVIDSVEKTGCILTVEEHNVIGGLGDAVASAIAEAGLACKFKKHGIYDEFTIIGYAEDLYSYYKLDANGIADEVRSIMGIQVEEDDDWEDE